MSGQIYNPELREALRESGVGLHKLSWAPIAADENWFLTSTNFGGAENESDTIAAGSLTEAGCPEVPVVPVIVVTDNAGNDWTDVSCTIIGIDQFGTQITEAAAATNDTGTWTATFNNAFAYLDSVTIAVTGTTTNSDAYVIGFAKTYGLGCKIVTTDDVLCQMFNGAVDGGTASAVYHTYEIDGTPDGADFCSLVVLNKNTKAVGY